MRVLRYLLSIVIFASFASCSAASTILDKPIVDERVELMSIVFRLAECDEFSSEKNAMYVQRINAHFGQFKDHPLIAYTKKIRKYGIGYDAVMQMAIHMDVAPHFSPLIDFNKTTPEARWGKKRALKFLSLLRKFYQDTDCATFFKNERPHYDEIINAFMPNYEKLDLEWYTKFYGADPKEKFVIIVAPGNGGNNYGPSLMKKNQEREIYAIMGAWDFDASGKSSFPIESYFPILLHEFNHSFVNPLLVDFKGQLTNSCTILFEAMATEMRGQAYGDWEVMFNESVVRAAVIQYMLDHDFDPQTVEDERNEQFYRGFIWIDDLVKELNKYQDNRDQFTSFRAYMPTIANAFKDFSDNIKNYEKNYNDSRPKVVSISEFANGSEEVDASTTQITINFDTEMQGFGYSIHYGSLGKKHYPEITKIRYSTDKKSVILEVKLEKEQHYQLILLSKGFKSKEKIPIKDFEINFKTK